MSTTTEPQPNWQHKLASRYNGTGSGQRYGLVIDERSYVLQLEQSLRLTQGDTNDCCCVIKASQTTFERLFRGQLSSMQAVFQGHLKIDGDLSAAMQFKAFFQP